MDERPQRNVETLFHASLERKAGPEREAYLDGACGDDAALRQRVDALLAAHDESTGFLEEPAVEGTREGPGTSIGPYKLLQEIGEGGMGVVYMAEQLKPVARKVALKVIKLGMDTKQVIARFEAERQALAMMDHPHIARVLDAGATEAGRPYFVMELVRGVAIHEYCDTHKLATEERLGLFVDVCRAVQHAHQKGVIHRDLKPSNVLVTSHDGRPVPKIIDFGVAKATNQRLTERTLFTEFRQIIGTPEYMSPEQAEMSGLDVDTRSDIYALGVLLYKLLTGTTPVDPTELRTAGFEEMTRMIREEEPPSPSTRISKLGADADQIASRRSSDAGSLSKHFRGDLDWIVMKALEKDRTRRYETASAFAEDVRRHLEDRPVEAGPPGTAYRVRKFAHRNRRTVAAALVLLAVVGLGLAGTVAGFLRARTEAQRSGEISASLEDVLAMTDSTRASNRAEVEATLATVRDVFGTEHATYAAVLDTLSARVHDAGDFDTAVELSRESLAVWQRVAGDEHPNVAITLARLGSLLRLQGEDEEAEEALRGALVLLEGAADAPGLAGYEARLELANLLADRGDFAEADELFGESLELLRAAPSPSHARILDTLEMRLRVQLNYGAGDALETLRAIYDEARVFSPDDSPMLAVSALGLGNFLSQRGEAAEAEPYLREAIQRFRASPEPAEIYLIEAQGLLFLTVSGREDPESQGEATNILRDLIDLARPMWTTEVEVKQLGALGNRLLGHGRYVEAIDTILEAHQVVVDAGYSFEDRADLRAGLTQVSLEVSVRSGPDQAAYARAHAAIERALEDDPGNPAMLAVLGGVLYREGQYELAAETLDLIEEPLSWSRDRLARRVSPADRGFRAMTYARLGAAGDAHSELAAFREALGENDGGEHGRRFLAEVEAMVERTPAGDVGG